MFEFLPLKQLDVLLCCLHEEMCLLAQHQPRYLDNYFFEDSFSFIITHANNFLIQKVFGIRDIIGGGGGGGGGAGDNINSISFTIFKL